MTAAARGPRTVARAALPAASVLVAALAACGGAVDPTSMVVEVDVDPALVAGTDFDHVMVSIKSMRGTTDVPFAIDDRTALPVMLALLPVADPSEAFYVTATAALGEGMGVVSQTAYTAFLPGLLGRVEIFLAQSCVGPACPADQSCLAGACVDTQHLATPIAAVAAAPRSDLKVQYMAKNTDSNHASVEANFAIVNAGNDAVPLGELTMRYWFTADGWTDPLVSFCDYAMVGCDKLTMSFHPVSPARFGADSYLEVVFAPADGNLAAGGGQTVVQARFGTAPSVFQFYQVNDFSFDPSKLAYADWPKVTLYRAGTLVWGAEP